MARPKILRLTAYGATITHTTDAREASAAVFNDQGHCTASQSFYWDGKPPTHMADESNPTAVIQAMRWARGLIESAEQQRRTERAETRAALKQAVRDKRAASARKR